MADNQSVISQIVKTLDGTPAIRFVVLGGPYGERLNPEDRFWRNQKRREETKEDRNDVISYPWRLHS